MSHAASNSRKTANILQEVGRALYGDIWQSELARDLGCNDRTVRKWNAGDAPIPEYLRGEVAKICRRRGRSLDRNSGAIGGDRKAIAWGRSAAPDSPTSDRQVAAGQTTVGRSAPGRFCPASSSRASAPRSPRNAPADVRG